MDKLKELRRIAGKTQTAVANDLGISQQAYGHYEVGRRTPDADMLRRLADYFGVSVDYLLGREEEQQKTPVPEDERDREILERFSKLSPADVEKVSAFIAGLLASKE